MNKDNAPERARNEAKPRLSLDGKMILLERADLEKKMPMTGEGGFVTSAEKVGLPPHALPIRLLFEDKKGSLKIYQVKGAIGTASTGEITGFAYKLAHGNQQDGHRLEIFSKSKNITL